MALDHLGGQHHHIHGHQGPITTGKPPPPPTTITKPPPVTDTVAPSEPGSIATNIQVLFFASSPLLAAPGQNSDSFMARFDMIAGALKDQHIQDLVQGIQLRQAHRLQENTRDYSVTVMVTQTDSDGNETQVPVTVNFSVTSIENQAVGISAEAVSTDLHDELRKAAKRKNKILQTHNLQAFVQEVLMSGIGQSLLFGLKLGLTSDSSPTSSQRVSGAISAASFATSIAMSGPAFDQHAREVFPDDPEAASILAETTKQVFNSLALHAVSDALDLPGLASQVESQAALVRQENKVLQQPLNLEFLQKLTGDIKRHIPQLSQSEIHRRVNDAIKQVASQGPYNTRQEMITALEDAFKAKFGQNVILANELALKVEGDALDAALAAMTFATFSFEAAKLNITSVEDQIKSHILAEFAKSEKIIHEHAVAAAAAAVIRDGILKKQLRSEQAVRQAIQGALVLQGLTPGEAGQIARSVNLGVPVAHSLTDSRAGVLSPQDYKTAVSDAITSRLHISIESPLGQSVLELVGASDHPHATDMIGLINAGHREELVKGENYLLPEPSRDGIKKLMDFLDPFKLLVLEWGLGGRTSASGTSDPNNIRKAGALI